MREALSGRRDRPGGVQVPLPREPRAADADGAGAVPLGRLQRLPVRLAPTWGNKMGTIMLSLECIMQNVRDSP